MFFVKNREKKIRKTRKWCKAFYLLSILALLRPTVSRKRHTQTHTKLVSYLLKVFYQNKTKKFEEQIENKNCILICIRIYHKEDEKYVFICFCSTMCDGLILRLTYDLNACRLWETIIKCKKFFFLCFSIRQMNLNKKTLCSWTTKTFDCVLSYFVRCD